MRKLPMRNYKRALIYKLEGKKVDVIRSLTEVGRSSIFKYTKIIESAGLTLSDIKAMSEAEIKQVLFPVLPPTDKKRQNAPDYVLIDREFRQREVTLEQLFWEYRDVYPDGVSRTQFYEQYKTWKQKQKLTMLVHHVAGERLYVDYAGIPRAIQNRHTGEIKDSPVFVAAFGASNYFYAEVTATMQLKDFIGSHIRAFEFFGGVPELLVPDNALTAVKKADLYEPELNATYQDMGDHYGIGIDPARVRTPTDKPKVEIAVKVVERQILAPLRHRIFFSVEEANIAIHQLVKEVNAKHTRHLHGSRLELFEQIDKPALRLLPTDRYRFGTWVLRKVRPDYHIKIDAYYYSVHYRYTGAEVWVKTLENEVEIYLDGEVIATHIRIREPRGMSTLSAHLAPNHRQFAEWTPEKIRQNASEIGPNTVEFVEELLNAKTHIAQWSKSCFGLFGLVRSYGGTRLESACARALKYKTFSLKSIKQILKQGLDKIDSPDVNQSDLGDHELIRGTERFTMKGEQHVTPSKLRPTPSAQA